MRHPRWIFVLAATVAIATGCQEPLTRPVTSSSHKPETPTMTASKAPDREPGVVPATTFSGVVTAPEASLVNDGGVILYRTLAVSEQPVPGAAVVLVDAEGNPVTDEKVTTDAEGRFTFTQVPTTDAPVFVQAEFELAGEAYAFQTVAEPGAETLAVDAASTLVAEKARALVKGGKVKAKGLAVAQLAALTREVRQQLKAEQLPFMGKRSKDMAAAFDQLLADAPALAAVASDLGTPAEGWTVETLLGAAELTAAGVMADGQGFDPEAAVFEVDAQGALYFATPTAPVKIVKVVPGQAATTYATLPADVEGPVRLALSPAGVLHVMALENKSRRIVVLSGAGDALTRRPAYPKRATLAIAVNGLGDRIAVNAAGDVFVAVPKKHAILRFPADSAEPSVLAGAWDEAGFADGAQGRFTRPASVAMGPGGMLYVADAGNTAIRRVAPDGTVSTVAGQPGSTEVRGGRGRFARFGAPMAIAVDAEGNVFFTDTVSRRIQRLSPTGSVFYVAGQPGQGKAPVVDGPGPEARFAAPGHLAVDGAGHLYVRDVDGQDERVRKVSR